MRKYSRTETLSRNHLSGSRPELALITPRPRMGTTHRTEDSAG
jgi:hypothetical protein